MRFLTRRRVLALLVAFVAVLIAIAGGLILYVNSAAFKEQARLYVIRQIETSTGASVTLGRLDWDLSRQRFQLNQLIFRGLEPRSGPPLASIQRIEAGVNLRSLMQRKLNLFELAIDHPQLHIFVDANGKTNFPSPPPGGPRKSFDFEISIENFQIVQSTTFVNERQIDTDLKLANLASELSFHSTTGILGIHLQYDGHLERPGGLNIPYTFDGNLDYSSDTLIAHQIQIRNGKTALNLQGRINDVLTRIAGRLEYTGNVEIPFLTYFFPKEKFAGTAEVAGFLEFSKGYFFTSGHASGDKVEYDVWQAAKFQSDYSYHFPEKRAAFRKLSANVVGGAASGNAVIENIPGPSRVVLDMDYAGVDAAMLARTYPWDPQYRIHSKLSGTTQGWFEGKFDRFQFAGDAIFKAYKPAASAGIVPLPIDGRTDYDAQPGQVRVANADIRLGSTHINAAGLIREKNSDLQVTLDSTDLHDAYFIYDDANGAGTFTGTLSGPIKTPVLEGDAILNNHIYQHKWTIQNAAGHVRLDTATGVAVLKGVHIKQGRSEIAVTGTTELDGAPADLAIEAVRVFGEDLRPYVDRKLGGIITGSVHLTSFSPMKVEGDLRAADLEIDDRPVGNTRSHVRYSEPVVELESLSITRNGSSLTGNVAFNQTSEALKFSTHITNVDFNTLRWAGLPEVLNGTVRQADLDGDGTLKQPNVKGNAVVQNLSFKSQVFPLVRLDLVSNGSRLNAAITAAQNLVLTAQIDTAAAGYPFTGQATFTQYSLEQLAGLAEGTLSATGTATLTGLLTDSGTFKGQGRIDSAEASIQGQVIRTTRPFTFDFTPERLALSQVNLTGTATQLSMSGTIGLTERAALDLNINGKIDLALLAGADADWVAGGTIEVTNGRITGTPQNPDLRGIAHLANAGFSRRGFFTSLSALNGDLFFDQNRITLNDVRGTVGGGTIQLQGNALFELRQVRSMNVRIEANDIRIRYPQGLRTVLDGSLILRGSLDAPLLEGNLKIESSNYNSSFDDFLALFSTSVSGARPPSSMFGPTRLALHVEGGRNITIQNQLATVEARVDLDIKGTVDDPALTGHVEASGGSLSFQGKRYTITRGNVDFVDPLRIEPVVDIQAESELRDYRIILTITGRAENLHLDMRSDPPLSQVEIFNLIAGGKTQQELNETYLGNSSSASSRRTAPVTSEEIAKGGAASILSDMLTERIAGSTIERLGISRVRIGPDPSLISAQNQTKLRLTVEQQVTKDMTITYSQDLSSSQQQIVQIEYFVTRNTSILATKDETGEYSLDVKFRKRLK